MIGGAGFLVEQPRIAAIVMMMMMMMMMMLDRAVHLLTDVRVEA